MPGISLKYDLTKNPINQNGTPQEKFLDASESLLHNDYYKKELLLEKPCLIVCTRYAEYPVKIIENEKFWACVEGKIYSKRESEVERELSDLLEIIFSSDLSIDKYKKEFADWLLDTDGDFVVYGLDKKTDNFFIMNDLLGRLPLYYQVNDKSELILSREIQLLSYLNHTGEENANKFDMMGIAQFLLFSHTLGNRTLLRNVSKMGPASILTVCNKDSQIKTHELYVFNFEYKKYSNEGIKKNAQELVKLFLEACKNRADLDSKNVLSLSGGLDSRAIAAGLHENKISYSAVSSPEPNWTPVVGNSSESEIAEKLAHELKAEWENYQTMVPTAQNLLTLLRTKNGLVYLAHSFLPRFLEVLKTKYGLSPVNFFTGHGGDVSFTNLLFKVQDVERCVRGIIHVKGRFPLNIITDVTKISKPELMQEIRNILRSYPERNPSFKLVHFLFFENNVKFSFEIEDVNRLYFWSVAPFYSVPFFKYIFNCSDKSKEKLALYREFFIALSPAIAEIKISNWGCSISSKKFKILQYVLFLSFKYPKLRRFIKKIYDKRAYSYETDSKIIQCIRTQLQDCKEITNVLSEDKVQQILNQSSQFSHEAIDNLFTVTSLIEGSMRKSSTIGKYY